jgi:hypothetical protein
MSIQVDHKKNGPTAAAGGTWARPLSVQDSHRESRKRGLNPVLERSRGSRLTALFQASVSDYISVTVRGLRENFQSHITWRPGESGSDRIAFRYGEDRGLPGSHIQE